MLGTQVSGLRVVNGGVLGTQVGLNLVPGHAERVLETQVSRLRLVPGYAVWS